MDVWVFSITVGDIDEIVGLVSPTVTEPPKETAEPLIVIALLASLVLPIAAEELISLSTIAPATIFAEVIASSAIFAVVTFASVTLTVVTASLANLPDVLFHL